MQAAEMRVAPSVETASARRILVAEDNPVTNDLLRLLLSERGHHVDIATTGEEALTALNNNTYDVVLMDFHLPQMDGLEVAESFRSHHADADGPRFIAITSDIKGLLKSASGREAFDTLLPKPLDINNICKVIEGEATEVRIGPPVPVRAAPSPLRRASDKAPLVPGLDGGSFNFLKWPQDFSEDGLSARGLQASLASNTFDAILVCQRPETGDLPVLWRSKALHVLPLIDLTGTLGPRADIDASKLASNDRQKIETLIEEFHQRRAQLHPDLLYSDDIEDKLLSRVFVSGRDLTPVYEGANRALVVYNTSLSSEDVLQAASRLATRGLLQTTFFDRMHICDRCGSSRFNVREICGNCHCANLREEAYLHHYACATQAPESDFRHGDDLVCPKCRKELSHFSVDYDKPGSVLICDGCGASEFDAAVGFVCVDCSATFTGDTVRTTDISSFRLTDAARGYLTSGRAALGSAREILRFGEMPIGLMIALNNEAKRFQEDGTPFTLVEIRYANLSEIAHEEGARAADKCRNLFLENLGHGLSADDEVFRGQAFDFALIRQTDSADALSALEQVRTEASDLITHDLGIEMRAYRAEEFH